MNPPTTPTATWNAQNLVDAFRFAATKLDHHRDSINAINVFPVPDGDTGTNMSLTLRGAVETVTDLTPDSSVSDVAERLAYGALMGARGNSGVILSQFFRGFASSLASVQEIDGRDFARALKCSQESAYKAVIQPVEGTMLTVIRGAADAASETGCTSADVPHVLDTALQSAQSALAETPKHLDILRQAGVVDAGGQGIVHIIDALARYARGDTDLDETDSEFHDQPVERAAFLDLVNDTHNDGAYGYCTNFMVFGENIDREATRTDIAAMGSSAVIVGDQTLLKVHVHTTDPGAVLQYAARLGELDQIRIDNMTRQAEAQAAQRRAGDQSSPVSADGHQATGASAHESITIVAVAEGDGISNALRSLGADRVVRGGRTMNPSTEELLSAVESCDVNNIILLPNKSNIIMTANHVDTLTAKVVRVVPTRSIPAALTALSAFNIDQDLEHNVDEMTRAIEDVIDISVTRANRTAEIDGIAVAKGQTIGLVNDELSAAGDDEVEVVLETITNSGIEHAELITVFNGEGVSTADQEEIAVALANAWPDAEIEMHAGGQPHYRYIISFD